MLVGNFERDKEDCFKYLLVKLIFKYLLIYLFRLNTLKVTTQAPAMERLILNKIGTKTAFSSLKGVGFPPNSLRCVIWDSLRIPSDA